MTASRLLMSSIGSNDRQTRSGLDPCACFFQVLMVEVFHPGGGEWTAEDRHAVFPFRFPHDRQPLDMSEMFQVKLDVFPQRTRIPSMKVMHDEQDSHLAMLLNGRLGEGNEFLISLLLQFAGDLDFDDFAFQRFGDFK